MGKKNAATVTGYIVGPNASFINNGIVYGPGETISESIFPDKDFFAVQIKAGKLIETSDVVADNDDAAAKAEADAKAKADADAKAEADAKAKADADAKAEADAKAKADADAKVKAEGKNE